MITNPSKAASMMFGFLGREQKPKPKPVPLPEPPIQMPSLESQEADDSSDDGNNIFEQVRKRRKLHPPSPTLDPEPNKDLVNWMELLDKE